MRMHVKYLSVLWTIGAKHVALYLHSFISHEESRHKHIGEMFVTLHHLLVKLIFPHEGSFIK